MEVIETFEASGDRLGLVMMWSADERVGEVALAVRRDDLDVRVQGGV